MITVSPVPGKYDFLLVYTRFILHHTLFCTGFYNLHIYCPLNKHLFKIVFYFYNKCLKLYLIIHLVKF